MATHRFRAFAFEENFSLREIAPAFPDGALSAHQLRVRLPSGGEAFVYPFGAIVLHQTEGSEQDAFVEKVRSLRPRLTRRVVREEFTVEEAPGSPTRIERGILSLDRMTEGRAAVVALTIAQSAAIEYYESIVDDLFERTRRRVAHLEARGTVPFTVRPLHRFIGEAIGTRSEVLSVLHLFDKPDETWEDPAMDRIYDDLRAEFDLVDRYQALESKLRGVQEALELVLDVARDRRLVLLEATVVLLIVLEIVVEVFRR